jgi:hypothetical protein
MACLVAAYKAMNGAGTRPRDRADVADSTAGLLAHVGAAPRESCASKLVRDAPDEGVGAHADAWRYGLSRKMMVAAPPSRSSELWAHRRALDSRLLGEPRQPRLPPGALSLGLGYREEMLASDLVAALGMVALEVVVGAVSSSSLSLRVALLDSELNTRRDLYSESVRARCARRTARVPS